MSLAQPTYLVDQDIVPIDKSNPLPVTVSGGGGGTVDQGAANGDAAKGWSARLTDGAAFIVPAKTGQLPAALGATTAAGSVSVGIATDQLSTLATAANQTTANSSLASILGQLDNKTSTLATEATASASKTLLGAGLPAALVGGKLDVNLGTSSITLPVSGPLTDAQLRAIPVPVSGTVTVTSTTANQGTGAGAAAPWSVQLSDGAASYTGVKTGQLPTTLGQTTKAASLSVALASDQVATVVGGAANAAAVSGNPVLVAGYDGTNARTIRTDSSGSIYAAGGSSYNTNGVNETRNVRTGAGVLIRLVINPGTSSSFVCYDNTAGSGTVLCALTTGSAGSGNGYSVEVGATFSTGLTYVSTGGCNVTLVYRAF